jgi:hypothetical protein
MPERVLDAKQFVIFALDLMTAWFYKVISEG